jgi:hypothetical protein
VDLVPAPDVQMVESMMMLPKVCLHTLLSMTAMLTHMRLLLAVPSVGSNVNTALPTSIASIGLTVLGPSPAAGGGSESGIALGCVRVLGQSDGVDKV